MDKMEELDNGRSGDDRGAGSDIGGIGRSPGTSGINDGRTTATEDQVEVWRKIVRGSPASNQYAGSGEIGTSLPIVGTDNGEAKSNVSEDGSSFNTADGNLGADRVDEARIKSSSGNGKTSSGKARKSDGAANSDNLTDTKPENEKARLAVKLEAWGKKSDEAKINSINNSDKAEKADKAASAGLLAKQIIGVHKLASFAFGPEAEIEAEGAEELAKAINAVCKEYKIKLTGKALALSSLAFAVATIELPIWAGVLKSYNRNKPIKGVKQLELRIPD